VKKNRSAETATMIELAARRLSCVRWIRSGEYSTLGRHRQPDEEDIAAAEAALAKVGRAGWIAVMSHSVHERTMPELLMVRPLRDPGTSFADAVQAFRRRAG
jgi:hypothetical protein